MSGPQAEAGWHTDVELFARWSSELFEDDRTFAEIAINGIVNQLEPIDITE